MCECRWGWVVWPALSLPLLHCPPREWISIGFSNDIVSRHNSHCDLSDETQQCGNVGIYNEEVGGLWRGLASDSDAVLVARLSDVLVLLLFLLCLPFYIYIYICMSACVFACLRARRALGLWYGMAGEFGAGGWIFFCRFSRRILVGYKIDGLSDLNPRVKFETQIGHGMFTLWDWWYSYSSGTCTSGSRTVVVSGEASEARENEENSARRGKRVKWFL